MDGLWREGDYWAVGHGGRQVRIRDSKGLVYLAELLRDPDREFHVLDLYRLTDPAEVTGRTGDPDLAPDIGRGVGPVLVVRHRLDAGVG